MTNMHGLDLESKYYVNKSYGAKISSLLNHILIKTIASKLIKISDNCTAVSLGKGAK